MRPTSSTRGCCRWGMLKEDEALGPEWMLHDERTRYSDFEFSSMKATVSATREPALSRPAELHRPGERRVVMLTATRNKSLWDVYNQLKLFLHPEDVTDLPIDPPSPARLFPAGGGR